MVYGQTELTRDLMEASEERGLEVIYQAADVALHDIESDAPYVTYMKDGAEHRIDARFIVGCDGFPRPFACSDPRQHRPDVRARLSLRLAGHPG